VIASASALGARLGEHLFIVGIALSSYKPPHPRYRHFPLVLLLLR